MPARPLRPDPAPALRSMPQAPYARVKQHLKTALGDGVYPPGSVMPSESDLVAQFGVSRMTVNRALRELQSEGLVQRVQGVGTFAARLGQVSSTLTIHDLQEEIESRGHRHHAVVHVLEAAAAPDPLAPQLGLQPGETVFHSLIVHHENGVPLQCEDRYVNPRVVPDYLEIDFTRITPTHYLFDVTSLWRAQYSIEAARPTPQEAQLLQIDPDEPCLVIARRTFTRDAPITTARLVQPGSRYSLQGEFAP